MLKNINEKLGDLPQESSRVVAESVTKLNDAIGDLIQTSSGNLSGRNDWSPSQLLRSLFSTASRAISAGLVGIVGYVIYRSYVSQGPGRSNLAIGGDSEDPELSKTKRSREEIEEVFLLLKKILFLLLIPN